MPEIIFVKPAPGLVVRDPKTKEALPPQGARKEKCTHWLRRRDAGDVEILPLPAGHMMAMQDGKPAKTAKPAAQAAPKE